MNIKISKTFYRTNAELIPFSLNGLSHGIPAVSDMNLMM